MSECVFCKIAAENPPNTARNDVFYSSEDVLAFMDIQPLVSSKAHVLVIPREHFPKLTDAPSQAIAALGAALPKITRAICEVTQSSDFNVVQNNGPSAGQVVHHVHFHVIARNPEDPDAQKTSLAAEEVRKVLSLRDRVTAQMQVFGRGQRTGQSEEDISLAEKLRMKL